MIKHFFISLLLLLSIKSFSQSPNYIFYNVDERQGLSANFCYNILKDSRGMIWVGTHNGLSRYDGQHFYNFKGGNDRLTFENSIVLDLCEDKEGNIWGATASGIFCYVVDENTFKNYKPPTVDFARSIKNIICDKRGNIWATSEWNILKLNKKKNVFEEVGPLTTNKDSLNAYSVRQNGLVEDPSGKGLWFATRSGLHFYNHSEGKFHSYKDQSEQLLFTNHSISSLTLSHTGKFWFFDNISKDIIGFDPATKTILYRINMDKVIPDAYGQTLFEDSNNRLWFSTWNNKMAVIDYKNNIITPISYKNDNPLSIAGENFWNVCEDEDNNIWLATAGGISKCNYSKNMYSIIPIVEKVPEFKNIKLASFTIDPKDDRWWFSSDENTSIIRYDPNLGKYNYIDISNAPKNKRGQLPGPIYGVRYIDDQPYLCTQNGVWSINEKSKKIIPFEKIFTEFPLLNYYYFTEYGENVWFATYQGFIKWNKLSNKSSLIKTPIDSFPDGQKSQYLNLFFDKSGTAWFFPAFGWMSHIIDEEKVVSMNYIKNKSKELAGYITSITEDKKGNLWMASTGVGLYKYNISSDEMTLYDQPSGISHLINQVVTDKEDRLWIGALNKFAIFDYVSKTISHYDLPIYANTLDYGNVMLKDSKGVIISTLYKDVVKFIPERLHLKPVIKEPLISMVKISGKDKLICEETLLNLEPDENSLEFNFGSAISNEIFPYAFEYKLEGFNESWITANNAATALYNNLGHGKYLFKVKAVANDKSWETPERIITINIRTPFYKAIWFWLMVGAMISFALIYFYRYRLNQQKQIFILETKAQRLEKEKTMVMYESLKQQLNPHFLFNSLTSLSGLIDLDQELAGSFLEQMSGIYRYILKNGDTETVTIKEEIEFVKLYISLQKTRFKNGLEVNINIENDFLHYKIAPVTLQNLIENAIKHNIIDLETPLVIDIFIDNNYLVVKNNLNKKNKVESSNKKGLAQFETLYKYLSDQPIIIEENLQNFIIKIPLI